MKTLFGRIILLVIGFLGLAGIIYPFLYVSAQIYPAIVRPDPLVFEVGIGQVKKLDIVLENATNVYGIQVQGLFDIQRVEVMDANSARVGIQMIPGTLPKPDLVMLNSADNGTGTFIYVTTQMNPTPPASGDGVVFSIVIRGREVGESDFTITSAIPADIDGMALPVTIQNGTIRVLSGTSFIYLPCIHK